MFLKKKLLILLFLLFCISCSSIKTTTQNEPFDSINSKDLPNNQKDNKILVGLLVPLSGKAEKIGNSLVKGAEMSVFDNRINNISVLSLLIGLAAGVSALAAGLFFFSVIDNNQRQR